MPDIVQIPPYQIEFEGEVCNSDGTQTWFYLLTLIDELGQGDFLSNWALVLCPDPLQIVDPAKATSPDPINIQAVVGQGQPCLGGASNPNTVKWNTLNKNAQFVGLYSFTIENGCFERTDVQVAIHTGNGCQPPSGPLLITGPSCTRRVVPPPVSRGFRLMRFN